MAIKSLNSVAGFSVQDGTGNIVTIIDGEGNVATPDLTVTGLSRLGSNSNVQITGGSPGQFLKTDGSGNLSWGSAGGGAGTLYIYTRTGTASIPVTGGVLVISGRSGNINVIVS